MWWQYLQLEVACEFRVFERGEGGRQNLFSAQEEWCAYQVEQRRKIWERLASNPAWLAGRRIRCRESVRRHRAGLTPAEKEERKAKSRARDKERRATDPVFVTMERAAGARKREENRPVFLVDPWTGVCQWCKTPLPDDRRRVVCEREACHKAAAAEYRRTYKQRRQAVA